MSLWECPLSKIVLSYVEVKKMMNSDEAASLVAMIIRYVDAHESEEKSGQKKITEQGIARSLTYYALEAIMTCWLHLPRSWYHLRTNKELSF